MPAGPSPIRLTFALAAPLAVQLGIRLRVAGAPRGGGAALRAAAVRAASRCRFAAVLSHGLHVLAGAPRTFWPL